MYKFNKAKHLNLRQIRRNAQVENILKKLSIKFESKDLNLYAKCPNPNHKDNNPSWHIYSKIGDQKNGIFYCWSCHFSGDIYKLIMLIKKCSFAQAILFVSDMSYAEKNTIKVDETDYYRDLNKHEPSEIQYKWKERKFVPKKINIDSVCYKYLLTRWIGDKYINLYGLLDWKEKKRIIIPITRNGKLISWIARSYVNHYPKTLAPESAPKKWELFGYDQLNRDITEINLAEGWVDAIRLTQINRPNSLAICGSILSEFQVESILWAKKIVLWLDGDIAGEVFGKTVAAWFAKDLWVAKMPKGTDPGYFSPAELREFKIKKWRI